jgi:hypothetical protein
MAHILKEFLTWRARETMEGGGFLPPPGTLGLRAVRFILPILLIVS